VLAVGAAFDDAPGRFLRTMGAFLALLACLAVLSGRIERPESLPSWTLTAYPPTMAALLAGYGLWLGHRFARIAAALALSGWLATLGWQTYDSLRRVIAGLDFIATGLILLALAELISMAKAGLLPGRLVRGKGKIPQPLE
jgi:amino acid transporter